jgi:glycogen(starch) synthase
MISLRILLPTDVFPPKCGGAGWSAHALATALKQRGHQVTALVPKRGAHGLAREDVLGIPTLRRGYWAPGIPFLLNYFRHERLWPVLAEDLVRSSPLGLGSSVLGLRSLIHAQHVQVTPAAIMAGERLGAPVIVTVRDHWPWDYFATGLHADNLPLPEQSWATLATDLVARLGSLQGAAALAAIPYMRAHLKRRQAFLRRAHAVIAPSRYIADRLATVVDPARIHIIPHMVDLPAIERVVAEPYQTPDLNGPFLLFVGKLERNKGAHLLPEVMRALMETGTAEPRNSGTENQEPEGQGHKNKRTKEQKSSARPVKTANPSVLTMNHQPPATSHQQAIPTLVVAGDGPLRPQIEAELRALGVQVRFLEWIDHDEVLRLMSRCALLLYPSAWGEPLTRVLLEACACGAPIVAMPTGGTPDIVSEGVNGLLAPTAEGLGRRAAEVLGSPALRERLVLGARRAAQERFSVDAVVGRVEELYGKLLEGLGGRVERTKNHY